MGLTRKAVDERGAVLVEFSLIAMTMALLMVVTVDFGRLMFAAQGLQDAARVAARELALASLPAEADFDTARDTIFSRDCLVADLDVYPEPAAFFEVCNGGAPAPVVNRALQALMIVDTSQPGRRLLRYPGALLADPATPTGFTVGIPLVTARDAEGVETIRWVDVVEEIRPTADPASGSFAASQGGLVALRLNYPYQAGGLTAFRPNPSGPFEPNVDSPIGADDNAVVQLDAPPQGTVIPAGPGASPGAYVGVFGLGRQLAFGREVRPFRRVLSAQAFFRREVFE
jgi:hypothetical protein